MRGLDDTKFGWVCFTLCVLIVGATFVVLGAQGVFS
jgi:hypothetical protein